MYRLTRFRSYIAVLALAFFTLLGMTAKADITKTPEGKQFINKMATEHGFDQAKLKALLAQAVVKQDILKAIAKPAEGKKWDQYRPIFITPDRIKQGVVFWNQHAETLARAEKEYGVEAQIIVAILGVETFYGRNKGGYRVMDALTTLGFHYPKRADFFRSELEQFLLLTREEKFDPLTVYGSYAGAMGLPQFISSSYRHYAVDFSGKGQIDLINNTTDVIGSVANYFAKHGWQAGKAVALPAVATGTQYQTLSNDVLKKPYRSVQEWQKNGITAQRKAFPSQDPAYLVTLQSTNNTSEHWLGFNNFFVITRYNRSPLYAMAVYQLSEAILAQKNASL